MGPEELLTEEEALKQLKVNKAQLENYVKEGKLSPLYQESVRKFKMSELSKIMEEKKPEPEPTQTPESSSPTEDTSPPGPTPPTPAEPPPIEKKESPLLKKTNNNEGSTRIIEPPKEARKIGVRATGERNEESFLKPLAQKQHGEGGKGIFGLLIAALVLSAFSVFTLAYNLKGKDLSPVNKIFGSIASLAIGKQESTEIENKTNSIISDAQQTKKNAETLIRETTKLIEGETPPTKPVPKTEKDTETSIKRESKQIESETLPTIQPTSKTEEDPRTLRMRQLEELRKNRTQ